MQEVSAVKSKIVTRDLGGLPHCIQDWPCGEYFVEISEPALCRKFLGPESEIVRQKRSSIYYDSTSDTGRAKLRLGMHDRGEEYLFAAGKIFAGDSAGHNRHLPLHVKVIRLKEHRIARNEVFDVTASYTSWKGLSYREELYVFVHIDRLIVEPGAKLQVHGNIFILSCGEIVFDDTLAGTHLSHQSISSQFEIHVSGTRHHAYSAIRKGGARNGEQGANGAHGRNSNATRIIPGPFGAQVEILNDGLAGDDGADGLHGENGTAGQNGGMAMLADLRLGSLTNFSSGGLKIFAQAGEGEQGGNGGDGGNGGNGGDGAPGMEIKPGGKGGRGGNGGDGGNGGHGGNGGLCSNIFVQVNDHDRNFLTLDSQNSAGGKAGKGGAGGKTGAPGKSDTFYTGSPLSSDTTSGNHGKDGRNGKSRPGPAIHVFTD